MNRLSNRISRLEGTHRRPSVPAFQEEAILPDGKVLPAIAITECYVFIRGDGETKPEFEARARMGAKVGLSDEDMTDAELDEALSVLRKWVPHIQAQEAMCGVERPEK